MRFYINFVKEESLPKKGKLDYILADGAVPVSNKFPFNSVKPEHALIAWVDRGSYDVLYLLTEFEYNQLKNEANPYKILIYDKKKAMELSGMSDYLEP